jgi:group II intron reverse transcriptase/maturase
LMMSLTPPPTVGKLQGVLRTKAKESPSYRFYALYDKMYREDVLAYAYRRCKANGGAAGVDGQTFADIEAYGAKTWLDELMQELKNQTYCPKAVRRVWIPKADGKQRPLGIPTIRDRVVQMAFMVVVEPIFDVDLQPEQHAYRPNHSAHQAIREVQTWLDRGYTEVVDADLSGYFDTIPHTELMQSVARRISDGRVLRLVKQWLEAAVEETDKSGRTTRTTRNKDEHRGTPQGGVASPLLANLYMRRFVLGWKIVGHERRLNAYIVNYADDFVICSRPGTGPRAMSAMHGMMNRLGLTVNTTKTRLCQLPAEPFKFLGYQFSEQVSWKTGKRYITPSPAKVKVQGICEQISELTGSSRTWLAVEDQVGQLNQLLSGWANYFSVGYVTGAWRIVQQHACRRLRWWLERKTSKRGGRQSFPDMRLYAEYGLLNLTKSVRRQSLWAKGT